MPLDPDQLATAGTPEWWMNELSKRMLSTDRMRRFSLLQAWADNCPPVVAVADSQRTAFYSYLRMARINLAGAVVRSRVHRMKVRSIRTAAANDDTGDAVANRYFTSAGLRVAAPDVHEDLCTLGEGYVRVMLDPATGLPIAVRRDPRYCITAQDPLNPLRTIAAMELVWDDWAGKDYAYLWLPGEQWVAERPRRARPTQYRAPGLAPSMEDLPVAPYWRLVFNPSGFTMRPDIDAVPEAERDGGPYSQKFETDRVGMVLFPNRHGKGEFEDVIPSLKRVNQKLMQTMTTAAVQAYKQRALKQDLAPDGKTKDRLPATDPTTGETIDWDDVFQPGPDALWKLPPGVSIWESGQIDLAPFHAGELAAIRQVSMETGTPVPMLSDDVNQSAEGSQARKEDLEFIVEDLHEIAGASWSDVVSLMFAMAPDEDRYARGDDGQQVDRADIGQIIIDWDPVQRHSLAERADADSKTVSLSPEFKSSRIWGLTPDEVLINKRQLADQAAADAESSGPAS